MIRALILAASGKKAPSSHWFNMATALVILRRNREIDDPRVL
jgi:hypothetical protein